MKWLIPMLTAALLLACSQAVRYPEGTEKGQCYGNQTCNSGLVCANRICVPSSEGGSGGNGEGGSGGQGGGESGGSSGAGGVSDTGGNQDTGGTTSSGGEQSGGASGGSGGSGGGGGTESSGGAQSSGGSSAAGGTSGGGGTTTTGTNACNTTAGANTVAFCKGQGVGAMTGYGWVALGSADTITDPTCDTAKAPITSAAPCAANTNWNKADALCMTGSIPALAATEPDYTGNWGVQLGVNAKDPNAGMGTTWKTVTISVSGSPSTGLRAVLHKSGDPDTTGYCLAMTPGEAMAITDFNSKCWDSTGDPLTEADSASIDKVGVQVTSTASAITVSDLCMTKIEFAN